MVPVLGQFVVKKTQMTIEHFLDGQNWTKFRIGEMPKSPGIAWKVAFLIFKLQNSAIFQDIDLKFCNRIHPQGDFHTCFSV